jgi:hypothetical protein
VAMPMLREEARRRQGWRADSTFCSSGQKVENKGTGVLNHARSMFEHCSEHWRPQTTALRRVARVPA